MQSSDDVGQRPPQAQPSPGGPAEQPALLSRWPTATTCVCVGNSSAVLLSFALAVPWSDGWRGGRPGVVDEGRGSGGTRSKAARGRCALLRHARKRRRTERLSGESRGGGGGGASMSQYDVSAADAKTAYRAGKTAYRTHKALDWMFDKSPYVARFLGIGSVVVCWVTGAIDTGDERVIPGVLVMFPVALILTSRCFLPRGCSLARSSSLTRGRAATCSSRIAILV